MGGRGDWVGSVLDCERCERFWLHVLYYYYKGLKDHEVFQYSMHIPVGS